MVKLLQLLSCLALSGAVSAASSDDVGLLQSGLLAPSVSKTPTTPTTLLFTTPDGVVEAAWQNHFAAFGSQNLAAVLEEYTEESIVTEYNHIGGTLEVFKGKAEIRGWYIRFFKRLFDLSDLAAPSITITEPDGDEPGNVLSVFSAPASGLAEATGTFLFDCKERSKRSKGSKLSCKVSRQNAVVTYRDPRAAGRAPEAGALLPATVEPSSVGPTSVTWSLILQCRYMNRCKKKNLFKRYTPKSVINVYNYEDGSHTVYEGLKDIKKYYKSAFDFVNIRTPVQRIAESPDAAPLGVFFAWSSDSNMGTETLISNSQGKVVRENVVIYSKLAPVQAAWNNHFRSWLAGNLTRILEDYTEDSVVTVFNRNAGGSPNEFKGIEAISGLFKGFFFPTLFNTNDLKAPIQLITEAKGSAPGSVFVAWSAPASGYVEATGTFVFDGNNKILRQNGVVTHQDPRTAPATPAPLDGRHPSSWRRWARGKRARSYASGAVINVYNQSDGSQTVYSGADRIKEYVDTRDKLFGKISRAGFLQISVAQQSPRGRLNVWDIPGSSGVETIVFGRDSTVLHNVVVSDGQFSPPPTAQPTLAPIRPRGPRGPSFGGNRRGNR